MMSDGDCPDCSDADCDDCLCFCCCNGGSPGHMRHCCLRIFLLLLLVAILVAAFAFVLPVRVTVQDASLARLALAGPNGTTLAYDVSLAVAVQNQNWAMHARLGAPLDAELLFAGEHFAGIRMRGSSHGNVRPGKTEVYNIAASGEGTALLGSAAVAEFVKESAAGGVFRLQLKLTGEVKYPPHGKAHRLEATCPLELPLSSPTRFKKIKCV
ncbi:hypothetical protein D1007_31004 [Hordeum vulgare]|nr:hypothetical protein D1007_31004 [Hordeum vulgare]